MSRAVFLDRDGVVNKIVIREGKICSPRTMAEFQWEDGISDAVATLRENGFRIIIVTNQPDIARLKMSPLTLSAMTERIYHSLRVDSVFVCPHDDPDGCECRKPKPGMLLYAAHMLGFDCRVAFIVGDGWKDMAAGRAAGCTTILLDRPYNRDVACDFRVSSLSEGVGVILELQKKVGLQGHESLVATQRVF
jgi:D-glycero-D-manno-heptose 1,7-bisphosphate phosphatase